MSKYWEIMAVIGNTGGYDLAFLWEFSLVLPLGGGLKIDQAALELDSRSHANNCYSAAGLVGQHCAVHWHESECVDVCATKEEFALEEA